MIVTVAIGTAALATATVLIFERRRAAQLERRLEKLLGELERMQRSFGHFAPEAVVEQIAVNGVSPEAREAEVTILFADLRGFTAMSDKMPPTVLVRILNRYFERMSAAIRANRGHVSKFMGDGLMAIFGAMDNNPWQANDAVRAALAMRQALVEYNKELRYQNLPELAFGVGIHKGRVVAGILGSDQLMEFTVIGDAVNVASRIESLTRTHDVDVIVSAEVREGLDPRIHVRALPATAVKGKPVPIVTFAIEGEGTLSQEAGADSAGDASRG